MSFPNLVAAIRVSGLPQWRIARLTDAMSESRLSRICRHGGASQQEREALSQLLGVSEAELFGPGPSVTLDASRLTRDPEPHNQVPQMAEQRS